jgi:limonene-1,2-epoxide hydrolase
MEPIEVVHAFLAAMEKKDYESALALIADDVEYINGNSPSVVGPEGIRQTLEPFFAPLKENDFQLLRQATNGNVVMLERLDRHLAEHGWFELPVTGVMEVVDGKINYWREYFDLAVIQDDIVKLMGAQ